MTNRLGRRELLAGVGMVGLAGCIGTNSGANSNSTPEPTDTVTDGQSSSSSQSGPLTVETVLPLPMSPAAISDKAVSGGPPKDGIPSIDTPKSISAEQASEWVAPGDPVFGVVLNGEVKAYPQKILVQHEICNDVIGGIPVSVTYCPLTGTAMGFFRGDTTFGVSGRLVNNNLIMYDRAEERWWPQVLSTSIPGDWNEEPKIESLQQFPVVWTTWKRWRNAYPNTTFLSRDTGFAREYTRDPYGSYNPRGGYYLPERQPMFPALSPEGNIGEGVPPKEVVIGGRTSDGAVAIKKSLLRDEKLAVGEVGETTVLAVYDPTLDTGYLYMNPEERSFEFRNGKVVDDAGGTSAPDSVPLDSLLAMDAMWFAWGGFYPTTNLYV